MSAERFIIVKYAETYFPDGKAPIEYSVAGSYCARTLGIKHEVYSSKEDARKDLEALQELNPAVSYGIVAVKES